MKRSKYYTVLRKLYKSGKSGKEAFNKFLTKTTTEEVTAMIKRSAILKEVITDDKLKSFKWGDLLEQADETMPVTMALLKPSVSNDKLVMTSLYKF